VDIYVQRGGGYVKPENIEIFNKISSLVCLTLFVFLLFKSPECFIYYLKRKKKVNDYHKLINYFSKFTSFFVFEKNDEHTFIIFIKYL
jgi:hypothetical protein